MREVSPGERQKVAGSDRTYRVNRTRPELRQPMRQSYGNQWGTISELSKECYLARVFWAVCPECEDPWVACEGDRRI